MIFLGKPLQFMFFKIEWLVTNTYRRGFVKVELLFLSQFMNDASCPIYESKFKV